MEKILCLDFDGVCHSYVSGWQGVDIIPDPPVEGLFPFLALAHKFFEIHIYSTRSKTALGRVAMRMWFKLELEKFHGDNDRIFDASWLKFPKTKPPAFVTLDDRVITFTGIWPDIDTLDNFKPWNK